MTAVPSGFGHIGGFLQIAGMSGQHSVSPMRGWGGKQFAQGECHVCDSLFVGGHRIHQVIGLLRLTESQGDTIHRTAIGAAQYLAYGYSQSAQGVADGAHLLASLWRQYPLRGAILQMVAVCIGGG